jgi:hypothetical protein
MSDIRPKELWLGEVDELDGNRVLVKGGAKTSIEELADAMSEQCAVVSNPSFHCYVERCRCSECEFLKDGPLQGALKKEQGSPKTWCDYWACYGAEPDGYCNRWRKP